MEVKPSSERALDFSVSSELKYSNQYIKPEICSLAQVRFRRHSQ